MKEFSSKGGKARTAMLTPAEHSELARKAVAKRWEAYRAKKSMLIATPEEKSMLSHGDSPTTHQKSMLSEPEAPQS